MNDGWTPGTAPVAVVMISLNEGHNLAAVLDNLTGWAQQVCLVDSYSRDDTIDIALRYGVQVVQRRFTNFGDQWNFALTHFDIQAPWTMKLDPDERLDDALKRAIERAASSDVAGMRVARKLFFMGRALPVEQKILRVWRTGTCRFSDVTVNEHPIVAGRVDDVTGTLEHHDSPNLHHWYAKQNNYSTAEALASYRGAQLAMEPRLLGTPLERRMWLKKHFHRVPLRFQALFLYNLLALGAVRAGAPGIVWARLRSDVYRMRHYKLLEMELAGRELVPLPTGPTTPDPRVPQF